MKQPIRMGVSSCLCGENVRYDGGNRLNNFVIKTLANKFELIHVCPETELGMGVPRETVDLEGQPEAPSMIGTTSRQDWTQPMNDWSQQRITKLAELNLCGFVFKKGSPSCGVRRVPVIQEDKEPLLQGRGLFAMAFIKAYPEIPVADELELEDPSMQDDFLKRVEKYARELSS